MREILFRGKTLTGRWEEGAYYKQEYFYGSREDADVIITTNDCLDNDFGLDYAVCIPETIGQYTGLTDKNGKKIFEGDIIDASNAWWNASGPAGHDSPIMKVKWSDEICGFDPFAIYDCDCGVYIYPDQVEVIGNIHDNPELLKEGAEK